MDYPRSMIYLLFCMFSEVQHFKNSPFKIRSNILYSRIITKEITSIKNTLKRSFLSPPPFFWCFIFKDNPKSHSYQGNRRANQLNSQTGTSGKTSSQAAAASAPTTATAEQPQHSLKHFLQPHIDLALTKGFDDNVGRNPVMAVFEVHLAYISHVR